MARSKGPKRPFAPGAGQDAGHRRQQDQEAAEHSFRGRNTGGQLHKRGEKRNTAPTPKPKVATPKPQSSAPKPSTSNENEAIAFSAMAAHRGAPSPTAQRDRLIELGIVKEVTHV